MEKVEFLNSIHAMVDLINNFDITLNEPVNIHQASKEVAYKLKRRGYLLKDFGYVSGSHYSPPVEKIHYARITKNNVKLGTIFFAPGVVPKEVKIGKTI